MRGLDPRIHLKSRINQYTEYFGVIAGRREAPRPGDANLRND
jgi:hypothetical protein